MPQYQVRLEATSFVPRNEAYVLPAGWVRWGAPDTVRINLDVMELIQCGGLKFDTASGVHTLRSLYKKAPPPVVAFDPSITSTALLKLALKPGTEPAPDQTLHVSYYDRLNSSSTLIGTSPMLSGLERISYIGGLDSHSGTQVGEAATSMWISNYSWVQTSQLDNSPGSVITYTAPTQPFTIQWPNGVSREQYTRNLQEELRRSSSAYPELPF